MPVITRLPAEKEREREEEEDEKTREDLCWRTTGSHLHVESILEAHLSQTKLQFLPYFNSFWPYQQPPSPSSLKKYRLIKDILQTRLSACGSHFYSVKISMRVCH